jgi:hydrogenase-4 component F
MIWLLLLIPALAGLAAFGLRWHAPRRALLVLSALGHAGLTAAAWVETPPPVLDGWIAIDEASLLFLSIVSVLFLAAAVYAVGYLGSMAGPGLANKTPEAVFTGCLLLFLAAMTLSVLSRHLGLMWVAVEATTLASAPLICFHRQSRSLEATWKYLLICSVGIAIALLGNFFVAVAARGLPEPAVRLTIDDLTARAGELNPMWLKAAFLLFLVGYGTKMGLAPLHNWLPDAHSEAPSLVSALLSGALLNCALLPILRLHAVLGAADLAAFSQELFVLFGLFSMGVAAVFIIGQTDFKRMLAYSSVEHMGIIVFGVGIGGAAGFGAMFHAWNHSLTKAMLFLAAGNILAVYRTKSTTDANRLLHVLPITGLLWVAGFLAICGSPPFGPFLSELTILQGAIAGGQYVSAALYLAALAVVFVGMATIVLRMAYGKPDGGDAPAPVREPLWSVLPPIVLGLCVLVLGVYVPPPLSDLLHRAAAVLGVE